MGLGSWLRGQNGLHGETAGGCCALILLEDEQDRSKSTLQV